MEQQFILRLPENLQNIDPKQAKITKLSHKEVKLTYGSNSYPGIICRLPNIVDSHKCIDDKLYKIADISTLIVIYNKKPYDIDEEIAKVEQHGLAPPMAFIKNRRKKLGTFKSGEIEQVERKVLELLREDAKAISVEYFTGEKEGSDDIDMLAAEIEDDLLPKVSTTTKETTTETRKIKEERRGEDRLHNPKVPDMTESRSSYIEDEPPKVIHEPTETDIPEKPIVKPLKPTELLELEEKIKEKQELFNKALNPILKKRFEQAVIDLKAEYEQRKKDLGYTDE